MIWLNTFTVSVSSFRIVHVLICRCEYHKMDFRYNKWKHIIIRPLNGISMYFVNLSSITLTSFTDNNTFASSYFYMMQETPPTNGNLLWLVVFGSHNAQTHQMRWLIPCIIVWTPMLMLPCNQKWGCYIHELTNKSQCHLCSALCTRKNM